jgi:hypothetical protein
MILSEETLKYPAACYCPPLIHTCGYLNVASGNVILYRYVLKEKDNIILLDILVFLLAISYCTGMF